MADTAPKPRRVWRWIAMVVAILVILPLAGLALFLATLDLDQYKPRITTAAEQATGRKLELGGPVSLGLSLVPTLELRDVAFANMPGGSRPQMLTVQRAEIQLALLPLISRRIELRRLVLVQPDLLLETDAAGRPNWQFSAGPAAQPSTPSPAQPAGGAGLKLGIGSIAITDGRVTYINGQTRQTHRLLARSFSLHNQDADGPLRLAGDVVLDDRGFTISGSTGPLARLLDPNEATNPTPFPVDLALEAEGARIGVAGGIARPLQGKGWRFQLTARVPELARFARWVPDVPLPALRDLQLSLNAADVGAAMPELSDLKLSIGESDLAAVMPELRLTSVTATLPRPDQPVSLSLDALLRGQPLKLTGSLGAPALLLPQGSPGALSGIYPLDLALTAGSATATLKGGIAQPVALSGIDLAVALRVPDLAAITALAGGASLPPLRDLAVDFRLAERSAAFASGAHLRGLRLTSSAADLSGELTLVIGQRTGLSGRLASTRVNLDALRSPAAPVGAGGVGAPPTPLPAGDGRLIPDTALPLDALKLLEADIRWTIAELRTNGTTLKDVALVFAAQDGRARLDDFTATAPGGRVQLRAAADVTTEPPVVQFALRSDQLDLPALLNSLGRPNEVSSGKLDLDIDLRGRGRTLRQVAASLDGHAGIALTSLQASGNNPNTFLGSALAQLRQQVPSGGNLLNQGLGIACAAFRFDAEAGIARARALFLDTTLGKIGGGGQLLLRDEGLALRLDTDVSLPIPGISPLRVRAPVPVTGSFAAPRFNYGSLAAGAVSGAAVGAAGQYLGGANNPLAGLLSGASGAASGAGELPDCASQLSLARGGRQGPVPASVAPMRPAAPAQPAAPDAGNNIPGLPQGIRGLFGR